MAKTKQWRNTVHPSIFAPLNSRRQSADSARQMSITFTGNSISGSGIVVGNQGSVTINSKDDHHPVPPVSPLPAVTLPLGDRPTASNTNALSAGSSQDAPVAAPETRTESSAVTAPKDPVDLNVLRHDGDKELLDMVRPGKTSPLYRIKQSQIQYGTLEHTPWSILGFRLIRGDDEIGCVAVKVEGTFHGDDIIIKGIWPNKQPNVLDRYQSKYTTSRQAQFQIAVDSKASALASFSRTDGWEHSFETGQRLDTEFDRNRFKISLSVERHSPRGTRAANNVEFFVLVQLKEERMPMSLAVAAEVTCSGWRPKKVVTPPKVHVYSGKEREDIRKGRA